jgi:hypothetical protein
MAVDASKSGTQKKEDRNRLAHTRWFTGNVFLRVWNNTGEYGDFYSVEVVKKWKRKGDAQWSESTSFTESELLMAAEAYRVAWNWVESIKEEVRVRQREAAETQPMFPKSR